MLLTVANHPQQEPAVAVFDSRSELMLNTHSARLFVTEWECKEICVLTVSGYVSFEVTQGQNSRICS